MLSEPIIVQLSSNPGYLTLSFIVLLFFFDVVLVRLLKLDDKNWKRIDYIWLGVGAIGVIASSAQAERFLASRNLEAHELYLVNAYADVRDRLFWGVNGGAICRSFNRTEYSPANFDDIVREYATLCSSYKEQLAKLPELPAIPPKSLEDLGFVMPSARKDKDIVFNVVDTLRFAVQHYNEIKSQYAELSSKATEGDADVLFKIMGPLLIAIALALRITKVTGELANAQRRNNWGQGRKTDKM